MITVTSFTNKPIGVLGLGRSGLSAVRALEAGGCDVWAWDDVQEKRDAAENEGVRLTDLYQIDFSALETIVLSPGIPDRYPEPHELTMRAREAGCELICDMDLLARENKLARFIGISGTNGKSTTTALIGHILNNSFHHAEIGGNYGIPALELLPLDENGTYVLEISSYQLERVPSMELDIAVLLNISEDHLDRHGGMKGYVAAKKILFERTLEDSTAIIGMEDTHCRGICLELMIGRKNTNIVPISSGTRVPGGVYVDNGMLIDDLDNRKKEIMDLRSVLALPGQHNWQNIAAAFAAVKAIGIEQEKIIEAINTYKGLAHRQEFIRVIDDISFINDSKATNTVSVAKALNCSNNIHWILGGQFKEDNLGTIEHLLERVSQAYLIGDSADQLAGLLGSSVPISRCGDLETAVNEAYRNANLAKPSTVLLSPACASFDQFSDFEARGDHFRALVNNLGKLRV